MKTVTINLSLTSSIARRFDLSDCTEASENSMPLFYLNTSFNGWAIIEVRVIGGFIYFPNPVCPQGVWEYLANFFRLPVAPLSPAIVIVSHEDYNDIDEKIRVLSGYVNSFGLFIRTSDDGEALVIPYSHFEILVFNGQNVSYHTLTDCLVSDGGKIFPIERDDAKNWILSPKLALHKNQRLQDLCPRAEELKLMPLLAVMGEGFP